MLSQGGKIRLVGWLKRMEFGLDFGVGEAHGLEEDHVVPSHGLGVGVIRAKPGPEDGKCTGDKWLRLRQAVCGL